MIPVRYPPMREAIPARFIRLGSIIDSKYRPPARNPPESASYIISHAGLGEPPYMQPPRSPRGEDFELSPTNPAPFPAPAGTASPASRSGFRDELEIAALSPQPPQPGPATVPARPSSPSDPPPRRHRLDRRRRGPARARSGLVPLPPPTLTPNPITPGPRNSHGFADNPTVRRSEFRL